MTFSNKKSRVLHTNRLSLKPFDSDYAEFFFELNANQNVLRFTGDEPFASIASAKQFLINYNAFDKTGFERLTVFCNEKPIGWCGLKLHQNGEVDLGFRFLESEWGKGYATEASLEIIRYAFDELKLPQIIARVMPDNLASISVLKKLGFVSDGYIECGDFQNALKYTLYRRK